MTGIQQIVDIAAGPNGNLIALDSTGSLYGLVANENEQHLPPSRRTGMVFKEMLPRPPQPVRRLTHAHDVLTVLVEGRIFQRQRDQQEMVYSKWLWVEVAPPRLQGPILTTSEFEAA
jgi:hypothetical protein